MGDGSGDLQKVWHEFAGTLFSNLEIIDIGAGVGKSVERLSVNNNRVITQDINRAYMTKVDLICYPEDITVGSFDIATAFDVIEHTVNPEKFVRVLWSIAKRGIFITTPNVAFSPGSWHYTEQEFEDLVKKNAEESVSIKMFYRYKFSNGLDTISREKLKDIKIPMAFGILCMKG